MQSLKIKRLAKQSSRVIASAILINCPAAAAAAAIPSSYFISTVSTNYSISTVLDLYRCWIYFTTRSTKSAIPPNCSSRPIPFDPFY